MQKNNISLFFNVIIKIAHLFALLKIWKSYICLQGTAQSLSSVIFPALGILPLVLKYLVFF